MKRKFLYKKLFKLHEFTLEIGEKIHIGGEVTIEHLEKTHPKAINAQIVRLGISAPDQIIIVREGLNYPFIFLKN